jgi:hypothetical protein
VRNDSNTGAQARSENSTTAAMSAALKGRMVGLMLGIMAAGSVTRTSNTRAHRFERHEG